MHKSNYYEVSLSIFNFSKKNTIYSRRVSSFSRFLYLRLNTLLLNGFDAAIFIFSNYSVYDHNLNWYRLLYKFATFNTYKKFQINLKRFIFVRLTKIKNLLNILIYNIKWILLAGIIATLYFFISLFYIQIDFTKQIAVWYMVLIAYYLLMSAFNTFLNKYRYGKFTSAIQRF